MLSSLSMTRLLPIAGAALAFAVGPALVTQDHTSEPSARFTLTLDDQTHAMTAGEPLEVLIEGKKHTLVLEESDTRVLKAAGFSFEYPRMMSFEYEGDPFTKIWTLDGNDAVVMIFQFPAALSLEEFVGEQSSAYAELGDVEASPAKITLEGEAVSGTRMTVSAKLFSLVVEAFPVDRAESSKRWLLLQDSSDGPGATGEEFDKIKQMLSETLIRTR